MRVRPAICLLTALLLTWGCAENRAPVSGTFPPTSFRSTVTVTGSDVPGPLRIRESRLTFSDGAVRKTFSPGEPVQAKYSAWINGHGRFVGHWERDGEPVDRLVLFLTYGETLEIILNDPQALPSDAPGSHTVRFVVEEPGGVEQPADISYEVANPYG